MARLDRGGCSAPAPGTRCTEAWSRGQAVPVWQPEFCQPLPALPARTALPQQK